MSIYKSMKITAFQFNNSFVFNKALYANLTKTNAFISQEQRV